MSTFESGNFHWIETYFVMFDSGQRPTVEAMGKTLKKLGGRFEVLNLRGNEEGQFESVSIRASDAYAAVDVAYLFGEEVLERGNEMVEQLLEQATSEYERQLIGRLPVCDCQFDVMHFEEVSDDPEEEAGMVDPSALLLVLGALVKLTDGVAIDPQSNTLVIE